MIQQVMQTAVEVGMSKNMEICVFSFILGKFPHPPPFHQ